MVVLDSFKCSLSFDLKPSKLFSMETTPDLRRSWYVLVVLMLAYISSFIDRQVLALLIEPIKRDFHVSDSQVGLLYGLSFALFYTFLGIPIGKLADTKNRKKIIVVGITVWSLMTAICGVTNSFWQLFLARMGVGVGEASLSPAAYSLITDMFPKNKLGTAMGIYNVGVFLGSGLSIFLVALIIKLVSVEGMWDLPIVGLIHPWQTVFFMVGIPGLLIVVLIWFTVQEPERLTAKIEAVPNAEVINYFKANKTVILSIFFGIAFMAFATYGATAWSVSSLVRNYGLKQAEAGVIFGLIVTVFSTGGVITGGRFADSLTKKGLLNGRLTVSFRAMMLSSVIGLCLVTLIATTYVPPMPVLLCLIAAFCFASSLPYAAAVAALQEVVPATMRGIFSALFLFVVNLIGIGLGPLAVGLINDTFFKTPQTILISMAISILFASIISATILRQGLAKFSQSVDNAKNVIIAQ